MADSIIKVVGLDDCDSASRSSTSTPTVSKVPSVTQPSTQWSPARPRRSSFSTSQVLCTGAVEVSAVLAALA